MSRASEPREAVLRRRPADERGGRAVFAALAPLLTMRRLRRTDMSTTLRVVE